MNWTPERRRAASEKAKARWAKKSDDAKAARLAQLRVSWTPERRQAASEKAKARFAALPDYVKAVRRAQGRAFHEAGRATYEARYPWRVPLFADLRSKLERGEILREPCDRCGGQGRMMLDFDDEQRTVTLRGWRCYPCRKAA